MISIKNTLVSEDIIEKEFVCNLSKCKGACCVEGISGAPLEEDELILLEQNHKEINDFLSEESRKEIKDKGLFVKSLDGEWETPLINGKECVFAVFSKKGFVQCGIEKAYRKGKINWKKPISCELYPIRIKKYSEFVAVNYNKWEICSSACDFGKNLKIPLYKFVKNALIRKFGIDWYEELTNHVLE